MTRLDDNEAADRFVRSLTDLREFRRLSMKELAVRMGFDPSYVSHIEGRRHRPSLEFARRADAVLDSRGALLRIFHEYGLVPAEPDTGTGRPASAALGSVLFVDHEESELRLDDDGYYDITITRRIHNIWQRPITRFPTRIEVDAYPADPAMSHDFYRENPVTLAETGFWARFDGEPTTWRVKRDRDAYKKIDILFEPGGVSRPVYPGQSATVTCGYRLHHSKWGPWFAREIRWPTLHISVSFTFPSRSGARLSGRQETWTAGELPLGDPLRMSQSGDATTFTWTGSAPALSNLYHFEWKFHGTEPRPDGVLLGGRHP
ncbi:helix-turn-helix domain-containing protein [Actinoplanes sp. G11-F43]|uniref:helix-turn-helix domain-containing protein n=1 Tax=Actinoplanes sp. G11-F43 TaxID=3424130 RepID=UPI003D335D4F